jgi:hypothetical protein
MKATHMLSRLLAPCVLAIALGAGFAMPAAPAQAQDDELGRVLVDIADVVFRAGVPYYRYGDYGRDDRLVVQRDRYGRPVYYRYVPVREGPPHGKARGYGRNGPGSFRDVECSVQGKCKVVHHDTYHDHGHHWRDDD